MLRDLWDEINNIHKATQEHKKRLMWKENKML